MYFNRNNALLILLLSASFVFDSSAQTGGRHVYEFLSLPVSSRVSGLGEKLISVADQDVNLAGANPAVLNELMHQQLSVNHRFFFSGIQHGNFAYANKLPFKDMMIHGGIQYIRYGEFIAADFFGNREGTFTANETALNIGVSKLVNERIRVGLNTKLIQSRFESYQSFGLGFDLGVMYSNPEKKSTAGLVFKNIGLQFNNYADERESIPFDIQLGYSKRLAHLPFRYSITAHQLHRWNLIYDDPDGEQNSINFGDEDTESRFSVITDNIFRHLIFSGEFLLGKSENIQLRFAYNHLRRKELAVSNYIGNGGFSVGAGIKFGKFKLDYAYSMYHLAGGSSHVGLAWNMDAFMKRF